MKVTLKTPSGIELSSASLVRGASGLVFRLEDVPRSNGLLAYYFGKSGRQVHVEADGREFMATLSTRYERNARTWQIVLPVAVAMEQWAEREATHELPIAS